MPCCIPASHPVPTTPRSAELSRWSCARSRHERSVLVTNALTRDVNIKQIRDRAPKLSTTEVRLKDMDRMGVDIQAVSPEPNQCMYWPEPDFGRELARMVNDRLAEIVATWPE